MPLGKEKIRKYLDWVVIKISPKEIFVKKGVKLSSCLHVTNTKLLDIIMSFTTKKKNVISNKVTN